MHSFFHKNTPSRALIFSRTIREARKQKRIACKTNKFVTKYQKTHSQKSLFFVSSPRYLTRFLTHLNTIKSLMSRILPSQGLKSRMHNKVSDLGLSIKQNIMFPTIFLNFSDFEPRIILKLFLNTKSTTQHDNQKNTLQSLFMFYYIIQLSKGGTEE